MSPVPKALRPQRSVLEIVSSVRAIHGWIDDQIRAGRSDDEIVAMAPVAIAFINGDITIGELAERVESSRAAAAL